MTEPMIDVLNEAKAKAWNEAIAPRAASLISYLGSDEWERGVAAYLLFQKDLLLKRLVTGCKTRDEDQFCRGQILMITEVLDLRVQMQKFLDAGELEKKAANSRGPAGY